MLDLLWLIPALPLLGFAVLALFGRRMPQTAAASVGAGSVGISALLALIISVVFLSAPPEGDAFTQVLWNWFNVESLSPEIAFRLDTLSLLMMVVVTFVGFLIHLYSVEFMKDDEGFSRFFAYMNLFVCSMLVLVLADNLVLLYLGWEGVGLCSYLLIGFWYLEPENGAAARKAFLVTRIGDAAMAVGLFLIFFELDTLKIDELMALAKEQWAVGSGVAVVAAALLFIGAIGKSAQLPLQTWLPDAMAGPTPVSALIHAATMVTAGVYLVARTHELFLLAPVVMHWVAIVGALTLLLASFSALAQRDIKRVLAYSTISQLGYMFLALGVGAFSAAMFHFMTHAFFKALLFLGAGAIIATMHHEHDMFKMGGLKKQLPVTFWTFLIGSASLAALPLITAGFYSKDLILWHAFTSEQGSTWLWLAGMVGALMTSIYTFRMVFVTFFGEAKGHVTHQPGALIKVPLIVLAVFSIAAGFVELPHTLGHFTAFSSMMGSSVPLLEAHEVSLSQEFVLQLIAAVISIGGIFVAWYFYMVNRPQTEALAKQPACAMLRRFWHSGWGFDWFYNYFLVQPFYGIACVNRKDLIDTVYFAIAEIIKMFHRGLSVTESGKVRWYAWGISAGAVILLAIVILS